MELGYFTMPSHPPECGLKEGHDWDLQTLRWLDELGYQEAWIGEHHTAPWEPHPSPDLLVAQALLQTKNIRIGPGGFLLPYHHPAELANRVAMLDHLSNGRLNFGVAASGLPSDWAMFNVDGMSGQNRDMTREALEIILKMWSEPGPWTHKGKYWTVNKPDTMFDFLKPHIKPLQGPHPPIGVAGLSKNSDTLKLAGERGFIPMSLNLNPAYVGSHWDSVEAGAAKTGRKPSRRDWRLVREVFVADTDEEAWKLSTGDMMGRMMGEYFLPLLGHFGFKDYLKRAPELDRRLAQDGHREDRADLPGGRRLRRALCVRLRLQAQAGGLAALAGPAQERGNAAAEASRRRVREGRMTARRGAGLASHPAWHMLEEIYFSTEVAT
jgi:alkanesulfonate monooxygenase SsuD/methylene tetrahydromethanopterin reductase-like flavin-dependent oxidoreductase (luciferase family)